jgi:hypothetical protein
LLTPELLDKVNQIVVDAGHELVGRNRSGILRGRCDSFVVETDIHYRATSEGWHIQQEIALSG